MEGLEDEDLQIPDLLYALVEKRFGVPIVRCAETLTAEAADPRIAGQLGIRARDPLVVLTRSTYTTGDRPIEYRVTRGSLQLPHGSSLTVITARRRIRLNGRPRTSGRTRT